MLFGDGAGAVVVSRRQVRTKAASSTSSTRSTAAAGRRSACRPAAACDPPSHETVDQRLHYVKQDGQTVFKFAVRKTEEIVAAPPRAQRPRRRTTSTCSCRTRPTAASSRRRPRSSASIRDKVIINIERFGNTTAATIPLALNDAVSDGPAEEGRSRAARVGRRRLHGRRGAGALGVLAAPLRAAGGSADRRGHDAAPRTPALVAAPARRRVPRARHADPLRLGRRHRADSLGRRSDLGGCSAWSSCFTPIGCGCRGSCSSGC